MPSARGGALLEHHHVLQPLDGAGVGPGRGQPDPLDLESPADEAPLLQLMAVDERHIGAGLRLHLDQTLVGELPDRVAHGGARDAEALGDLLLDDDRSRGHAQRQDRLAQEPIDLVRDRGGAIDPGPLRQGRAGGGEAPRPAGALLHGPFLHPR